MEAKKIELCKFFKSGCNRGAECPYVHCAVKTLPEVKVGAMKVMALQDRGLGSNYNVLIDSGANEVVRPYNSTWRSEICVYKSKGIMVSMTIAGGMTALAAMTQHGETMLKDRGLAIKGWIIPVSRLTSELVIKLTCSKDVVTLVTAGGKFKRAKVVGGLPYLLWE